MLFYILVLLFYLKEKKMIPLRGKKTEEKQNRAIIMISVDGKGTVFPVKLKLQGE